METPDPEITVLLNKASGGDDDARSELFRAVQEKLRSIAKARLRDETAAQSIDPTILVNDAYMQLVGRPSGVEFNDRKHFFVLAAKAMRRTLVDHARKRLAAKRGGPERRRADIDIDRMVSSEPRANDEVLALHDALKRLTDVEPRQAEVIELRHFGGYTVEQTAALLGVSERTVKGDFASAKDWLRRELTCA